MSSVVVNVGTEDLEEIVGRIAQRAVGAFGGGMSMEVNNATGDVTLTWPVTLTAGQITTVQEQARAAKSSLLSPVERNAIQADIDGLVTYQGIASPTLAQTASAVKAQSRILRAILRS